MQEMNEKKLFILDASGYLYRSYFAIRNMTNEKGESTNALYGFIRSFLKLLKDFNPKYIVTVFDGPNNAMKRKAMYSEYKAHRTSMPPDLSYQIDWAKKFCDLWGVSHLNISDTEADDTMGTVAKWGLDHFDEIFLCTSDKDMCQMVDEKIKILNTHKENTILGPKEVEEIHGVPPHLIIDLLAIIGDSSDNVPGVSGLGPKGATALLKEYGTLENLLQNADKIGGKKQEMLVKEADLARLSKQLVTIDLDVEIPRDLDFYSLKSPCLADLKEFYIGMSFRSLLKEFESILIPEEESSAFKKEEQLDYIVVDEETALKELVDHLQQQPQISLHTESTDLRPLRAELVGIGFGIEEKKAWYVPLNGKLGYDKVLELLTPLFTNPRIGFYGHNLKYDLQVLGNHQIPITTIAFDTMLASYLLHAHQRQHSIDALALEHYSFTKTPAQELLGKGKQTISMRDVPISRVTSYCCEDVDFCCRLKHLLEIRLEERGLLPLLQNVEIPLLRILAKMERNGIYLDVPFLAEMSIDIIASIKALEQEIYQLAGEEFNINSPKQMSEILFGKMGIKPPKKTATGHSTNAEVLEYLKDEYPIAGKLSEYRVLEKLRSTYIDSLPLEVDPRTQRIHCNFNQSVAATGRLASQDPNLQNIPIRTEAGKKIRAAFKPQKEGWSFLAADYSQIELRLLAHLSQDTLLIDAFTQNEDIHRRTASNIFNVPIDEVTQNQRYQAKTVNFGIIYGQQAFGLSQELGIDVKEAKSIIEIYFERYSGIKKYIDESKQRARDTGKAVTLIGRERIIPEINSRNGMLRAAAERLAINTPLQGSQADLIKLAMIEIDKRLTNENMKAFMVLQIHDELVFEAPDEELPKLQNLVKDAMEGIWSLRVPLIVDISIGKNWAEC